ncbi:MAG: penicillin-binding protein activator [Deltaproteobacteria bacterium]|jgi:branched-chain amino acid transport system substrate-binding protein|nr:penicillin-binding protein activator [Deltaproteobacteria bacterium]
MPSAFRRLALVACLLAFAVSCVQIVDSGGPSRRPAAEDDLTQADRAFAAGDYAAAAAAYRRHLAREPQSPRREPVLASAGLASERAGRWAEAVESYQALLRDYPGGQYASQAAPRLPDLLLLGARPDEALSWATRLLAQETDPARRAALSLSQGRAQYELSRFSEALDAFLQARRGQLTLAAAERGAAAALMQLDGATLYELIRRYGQNYPGPEASWHLARLAALSGDAVGFQRQADYFRQYFPAHPWTAKLAALGADPRSPEAQPPGLGYDPRPEPPLVPAASSTGLPALGPLSGLPARAVVAAVLPLTVDPNAKFGVNALAGLKLALAPLAPRVTVAAFDTEGDPGKTVKLIYEAAADPEVLAVVGPLTSREALAAAQTAQTAALPLVAVSPRLGLTQGRPFVFRIFFTPKHQAEAVARWAVKTKGLRRLGALCPDDQYGQAMLSFFRDEALRLGVEVTAVESYSSALKNWPEAVVRLTGGGSVRRASTAYQAPVPFEALFLPDSAPVVAQILPLMAYHDVTKMQYLGSALWLTDELPQSAGRYLEGAAVPDAFSKLSARPEATAFQAAYAQAERRPPDQFAAYGHDAGVALAKAFSAGAGGRNEVVRALKAAGPFQGATGPFSFGPDGEYQVEPAFLTVEGREYVLLSEPAEYH